jgi:CheY-like chemotaxis protein
MSCKHSQLQLPAPVDYIVIEESIYNLKRFRMSMQPSTEDSGGSSFSMVVIKRILDTIGHSNGLKKTNLAAKTGLNYPNCIRYLELLKLLGWVRIADDGTNNVYLTDHGIYFGSMIGRAGMSRNHESILESEVANSPENMVSSVRIKDKLGAKERHYNIMIVDDEPDVLLMYKIFLADYGYSVEAFGDAKSALQNIASVGPGYYDLIITDIRMKTLNGLHLYRGAKSIDPNVRIIFVSALDAVEELVSLLPGVTKKDIMQKPVEMDRFIRIVNEAIREVKRGYPDSLMTSSVPKQK